MKIDKVMALRVCKINSTIHGHQKEYSAKHRGITVVGSLIWNEQEQRQDIVFAWSIQNPRDQYSKKEGITQAVHRMKTGLIVQTNYTSNIPLKYQFFNAVANTREFFHCSESGRNRESIRFIDLSFYALAEIAEHNGWFVNVSASDLPSIHPDILINYIHKMNKAQLKLCGITDIVGRSPFMTNMVNKSYGV